MEDVFGIFQTQCTNGTFKEQLFGNDIILCAGFNMTDRENGRFNGIPLAAHNGLQLHYGRSAHKYRINTQVGRAPAMSAFSLKDRAESKRAGRRRKTSSGGKTAARKLRQTLVKYAAVEADERINPGVFQHAFLNHGLRAGSGFFAGLENHLHVTDKVLTVIIDQLCGADTHGYMRVVTTGVHVPVGGLKGLIRFLANRQGIAVHPDSQALAGSRAVDDSGHRCTIHHDTDILLGDADCLQFSENHGCSLKSVQTDFRNLMDFSAHLHNMGLQGMCLTY